MNTQEKTKTPATTYLHAQPYTLDTGKNIVTITLITDGASFSDTNLEKKLTYGSKSSSEPTKDFTVYANGTWIYALVETYYDPVTSPPITGPSYCHIYFKVYIEAGGNKWLWATDVQTADNTTIFSAGSGEHNYKTIKVVLPTVPNIPGHPSTYPNLNKALVFLLDKNTNRNLLFRGNEPLDTGLIGQQVDFPALHNALKSKYETQTGLHDFPEMGEYVLRDVAFLDHNKFAELPLLKAEISSFGATEHSQVDQKWFPTTPVTFSGMKAQVSNWDVETSSTNLNVTIVKNLTEWMNTQSPFTDSNTGAVIPVIYYIHCSSGIDRTGIVSSGYLMKKYGFGLSMSFILGTTIHKISYEGHFVANCDDISTQIVDPNRSRAFVAGTSYNKAIVNIYNSLNNVSNEKISSTALSGDPAIQHTGTAYVYAHYPWEPVAIGKAELMASGFIFQIEVLKGGIGYTEAPTVTIEAPLNEKMQATAVAEINEDGVVTNVTMTNQGSGYDFVPQVTFSSPNET